MKFGPLLEEILATPLKWFVKNCIIDSFRIPLRARCYAYSFRKYSRDFLRHVSRGGHCLGGRKWPRLVVVWRRVGGRRVPLLPTNSTIRLIILAVASDDHRQDRRRPATTGNDRQRPATTGNDWRRLATTGNDWRRLATTGNDWQRLATTGDDRQRPGTTGNDWRRLATTGNDW